MWIRRLQRLLRTRDRSTHSAKRRVCSQQEREATVLLVARDSPPPREPKPSQIRLRIGNCDRWEVAALEQQSTGQSNRHTRPREDRRQVRILRLLHAVACLLLLDLLAWLGHVRRLEANANSTGGELLHDAAWRERNRRGEEGEQFGFVAPRRRATRDVQLRWQRGGGEERRRGESDDTTGPSNEPAA